MALIEWIGLGIAALGGILTALAAKVYKWGPFLEQEPPEVAPEAPHETPVKPLAEVLPPPTPTVEQFCRAIEAFEGGPNDASGRNKNPGNVRFNPTGYLPIYGNVRKSVAGFAIFPTYELGWLYLVNMVKGMIHAHPNQTIYQFMASYAPPSDNNPTLAYASFIAKKLGVDILYRVKDLG